MGKVLLILLGVMENLSFLFLAPYLANFLGIIDISNKLDKVNLPFKEFLSTIFHSNTVFFIIVIIVFASRALYLLLLHFHCFSEYCRINKKLRSFALKLNYIHGEDHTPLLTKTLLTDLTSTAFVYEYHYIIILSSLIPAVLLSISTFYILGAKASLGLLAWFSFIFLILRLIINKNTLLGDEINNLNIRRFDEISIFSKTSRLVTVLNKFDLTWSKFSNMNLEFGKKQFYQQFFSGIPKVLVEASIFLALIIISVYYKSVGYSKESIILIIVTLMSALYKLMPLIVNISTSISGLKSVLPQKKDLEKQLSKDLSIPKYLCFRDDENKLLSIESCFFRSRLGNEKKTLSFTITGYGLYSFYGKSGAGKSTLSDMISGLLEPTGGDLFINKELVFDEESFLGISRSFQDPIILKSSLRDNLLRYSDYEGDINSFIDMLGLSHLEEKELDKGGGTSSLSGGEAKRVDLLRALLDKSKLKLIDEPEAGLDKHNKENVMRILKEFAKNNVVIVFTHDENIIKESDKSFDLYKLKENHEVH